MLFTFISRELIKLSQVSMITFEDMIDRLEKNSGQTVVSLKEAKMLLKVRKTQHCSEYRLKILCMKTDLIKRLR